MRASPARTARSASTSTRRRAGRDSRRDSIKLLSAEPGTARSPTRRSSRTRSSSFPARTARRNSICATRAGPNGALRGFEFRYPKARADDARPRRARRRQCLRAVSDGGGAASRRRSPPSAPTPTPTPDRAAADRDRVRHRSRSGADRAGAAVCAKPLVAGKPATFGRVDAASGLARLDGDFGAGVLPARFGEDRRRRDAPQPRAGRGRRQDVAGSEPRRLDAVRRPGQRSRVGDGDGARRADPQRPRRLARLAGARGRAAAQSWRRRDRRAARGDPGPRAEGLPRRRTARAPAARSTAPELARQFGRGRSA